MKSKSTTLKILVPILIAAAFIAGLFAGRINFRGIGVGISGSRNEVPAKDKLNLILDYISADYVDVIDTDSLLEAVLPDLLTSLDPHTVYIPAEDFLAVNSELEGSFSGIGISFNMLTDTVTVLEVISGGPSESAGLLPGDRIVTIDDSVACGKGWNSEKIITRLRGPEGTKVKLGIKRASAPKLLEYVITRGEIPVTSIDAAYMISPKVGYIKVNKFGRTTFDEFYMEALKLRGDGADDIIIDLRGNGGGYMEMAINMANEFLDRGAPIVSTKARHSRDSEEEAANGFGSLTEMGIAVLMDEYSASASEIFAGAIQDNDRGLIVGRRSFGKGLVQKQIVLPDSSAIRLTIARYYTPSGRSIQKQYEHGGAEAYSNDLLERFDRGEAYSADSIKLDKSITFHTTAGRPVYGGGGIMPDIFVPNDTTGITSYYMNVANGGELQKFAFEYCDTHRKQLSKAKTVKEILAMLPADSQLLSQFAQFAEKDGYPQRWYYINISSGLIVNQLKALIARTMLGVHAYYEVINEQDATVQRAIKAIKSGENEFPIKPKP